MQKVVQRSRDGRACDRPEIHQPTTTQLRPAALAP